MNAPSNCYLREIEKTDLELIQKWRHDPELVHYLRAGFRHISSAKTKLGWRIITKLEIQMCA